MAVVREHNGVHFIEHCSTPVDIAATFSHNGREWKVKGKASVVEMRGSYKYGHEFHVTVHCSPLQVSEKRANGTPWTRIEIAIPFYMGIQWLQRGLDSVYEGQGKLIEGETALPEVI